MIDLDQLKSELSLQYQADCWIFLEDLEHRPSSTLYKTLLPLHKEAYQDPYRFVFFNFAPLNAATLEHVVRTVSYIDISPYFIQVVTNQPATATYFEQLAEPINARLVSGELNRTLVGNSQPIFNNSNNLCAHAWAGLHADPNGVTRLCCEYQDTIKRSDGTEFNLRQDNIVDILSSDYMIDIRNSFRQGKTPTACKKCVEIEHTGGMSKRALTPFKLKNVYGNINWESDSAKENLGWVGGHLGNLCNLKCRICNPTFSSSIAVEQLQQLSLAAKKDDPVYHLLSNNSWNKTSDQFWTSIRSLVPRVKNFEFLGGEPLLLKENLEFMQWLVDAGHSHDCIFEFVTNGTQYPQVFDSVDQFQRLTITVSIDNIGKRFELERSGASWDTVSANLTRLVQLKQNTNRIEINVSITLNIQNILYLPELIVWLREQQINNYYLNWLETPRSLSIDQMTAQAKQLVLDRLTSAQLGPRDRKELEYVIQRVEQAQTSDGQEFCRYMQEKDRLRNENFAITHKEIANAMGYVLN